MRPFGIARLVSAVSSISAASAGFMVAMMLVPAGVTAARFRIVGDLEKLRRAVENRGMAFDMKGKYGGADHDDEVMSAQRLRELAGRSVQEACELRMAFPENCIVPRTD